MSKAPESETSALGCLLSGTWTLLSLPFWIGAFVLLAVSTTDESRLFAAALICLLPIPLNVLHWRKPIRKFVTVLLLLAGTGALFLCVKRAPEYQDDPDAAARVHFRNGFKHARYSPANLVAEIDQQLLGSYLLGVIDPNLGWGQAAELRENFKKVYRELDKDPELAPLPSVLGLAYREMMGLGPSAGNLFVYLPEGDQPRPAIVFLHGSLGNFKGYWKLWKSFADAHDLAIVAPSFGAGNWHKDGGLEAIEQARTFCEEHPRIDGGNLVLAGLSNGGIGVTRGGRATPKAWRGLLYLSPVMEKGIIDSQDFANGWGGRKALIITGEKDKRTPANHIREAVESMEEIKMKVTTHYLPDQDHFLVFADWPRVEKLITGWIQGL